MSQIIRTPDQLRCYQKRLIPYTIDRIHAMWWVSMGAGKTVSAQTVINYLLDTVEIRGCLVTAPLRVCQTVWAQESKLWTHLHGLEFSIIHGKPETRHRALRRQADIYLINYEALPWLIDQLKSVYINKGRPLPFDMMIYDEVTKLKSARIAQGGGGGKRARVLLDNIQPRMKRIIGMTGTPAPNGYRDLFGQYLMVDGGRRLGRSMESYTDRFFSRDYTGFKYKVRPESKEIIHSLISDITFELNVKDYLDLPPTSINTVRVRMESRAMKQYRQLERDMFVELNDGIIEAVNRGVAFGKCTQFASGAIYHDKDHWEAIHDEKLKALEEIMEEAGSPVLVAYPYRHGIQRIKDWFKGKVIHLHGKISGRDADKIVQGWNAGEIRMLAGHPGSIGHGLNLQYGSNTIAWYGLTPDLELYNQFNGRIADRQGQTKPVTIHHILTEGTVDFMIQRMLEVKTDDEEGLKSAIRDYQRSLNL